MTIRLAQIVRHPIKALGAETVARVELRRGAALPWDRHWALVHAAARCGPAPTAWAAKMNFLRGVAGPQLMAIRSAFDEATGLMRLTHPGRPDLTFAPRTESARLVDWVAPLWPATRPAPRALVQVPGQAMTDWPDPFISVLNLASNAALGAQMGRDLSIHRWRGNLWLDGLPAWDEFALPGRRLHIGGAVLRVVQRITRCKATGVNPDTGVEDGDTLAALAAGQGHEDFGVYAVVEQPGTVMAGAAVEVTA